MQQVVEVIVMTADFHARRQCLPLERARPREFSQYQETVVTRQAMRKAVRDSSPVSQPSKAPFASMHSNKVQDPWHGQLARERWPQGGPVVVIRGGEEA